MISPSKLKLEPGEALIDPLLQNIARITKRIGDQEYHAWVDARLVGAQDETQYLQCFPDYLPRPEGELDTVGIVVNEWTLWKVPSHDFNSLEWLGDRVHTMLQSMQGDKHANPITDYVRDMYQRQEIIEIPLKPRDE